MEMANIPCTTTMKTATPVSSSSGSSMNTRVMGFLERQKMYQALQERRLSGSLSSTSVRSANYPSSSATDAGRASSSRVMRQRTRSASDVSNVCTVNGSDGRIRRRSMSGAKSSNWFQDRSHSLNGLRGIEVQAWLCSSLPETLLSDIASH